MGIISRGADTYYTYRMLKLLTTDWKDMEAYEYGIIDDNGNVLRKSNTLKTTSEKSAYTLFHRLVFNLKRILEKLPFGKSRLASYAAALFLLREETNLSQEQLKSVLDQFELDFSDDLTESRWNVMDDGSLAPGTYHLKNEIASPLTGEMIARKGSTVIVPALCEHVDVLFGVPVFKVKHSPTKTDIYVTPEDLAR